jgi:hypothetical protein
MKLKEPILKVLDKHYEPLTLIELKFSRYDLAIKTNEEGLPVLLFMGKKKENGQVVGERYARRLKHDDQGNKIKDHWEHKGKAT